MLRLQHEADCLSPHRTERSLRPHPISRPRSGATLPRERFSPPTPSRPLIFPVAAAEALESRHSHRAIASGCEGILALHNDTRGRGWGRSHRTAPAQPS